MADFFSSIRGTLSGKREKMKMKRYMMNSGKLRSWCW